MKRNLFLLALLVVIAALTYVIEETGVFTKKDSAFTIFSPSFQLNTLKEIELPGTGIKHDAGQWSTVKRKFPVSEERMNEFFTALAGIKVRRIFSENEMASANQDEMFAKDDPRLKFTFKTGSLYIRIGKKIPTDEGFYAEVVKNENGVIGRTVVVAHDTAPRDGVYLAEGQWKSPAKYIALLNRLMAPEEKFMDTRAIRKSGAIKKVILQKGDRPSYEIDFANGLTLPRSWGLPYRKLSFVTFEQSLRSLNATKIIFPEKSKLLGKQTGWTKIFFQDRSTLEFSLYDSYAGRKGYFLSSPEEQNVMEISAADALLFALDINEFWDKRFFAEDVVWGRDVDSLKVVCGHKDSKKQTFSVKILNDTKRTVIMDKEKQKGELKVIPNQLTFNRLMDVLSGAKGYFPPLNAVPCETIPANVSTISSACDFFFKDGRMIQMFAAADAILFRGEPEDSCLYYSKKSMVVPGLSMTDLFYSEENK